MTTTTGIEVDEAAAEVGAVVAVAALEEAGVVLAEVAGVVNVGAADEVVLDVGAADEVVLEVGAADEVVLEVGAAEVEVDDEADKVGVVLLEVAAVSLSRVGVVGSLPKRGSFAF